MSAPGESVSQHSGAARWVGLADRWTARQRAVAWAVTMLGLAVSVADNVGHVAGHDWTSRGTAAIPPLAGAAALRSAWACSSG